MNAKELRRILDLMDERGVAEIEIRTWFKTVRINRHTGGANVQFITAGPPDQAIAPAPPRPAVAATVTVEPPAVKDKPAEDENLVVVKSPMVGTFYRAPAPDAEPYAQVGTQVKRGQVLCIIEAMKIMNEIESEYAGEIVKIHAENAAPVQYGQPLFSVRPA